MLKPINWTSVKHVLGALRNPKVHRLFRHKNNYMSDHPVFEFVSINSIAASDKICAVPSCTI